MPTCNEGWDLEGVGREGVAPVVGDARHDGEAAVGRVVGGLELFHRPLQEGGRECVREERREGEREREGGSREREEEG